MADFEYYLAQFVDIHGRPKAKLVPGKHKEMIFGEGAGYAGGILSAAVDGIKVAEAVSLSLVA